MRELGLKEDEYDAHPRDPRPPPDQRRAGDVLRHVERALLVQVVQGAPAAVRREGPARPTRCSSASARTPASSTSARAGRSPSRSSRTTTRRYVEPYQGAATGVGGIVRDIISMGARPVAVMDPLRFGAADHPDTARVLPGVVAGIGGYGNCLGLPNIGGEVVFDASLPGQPAGQRPVRRRDAARGHPARAARPAPATWSSCSARDRRRRHRRRLGAGVARPSTTAGRPSARRCRSATRSRRRCSSSAASRSSPRTWSSASRTSAAPACPAPPSELASAGDGGMRVDARPRAAARRLARARGDPHERVAGTHVRGRRAGASSTRSSRSASKWDVDRDRHR